MRAAMLFASLAAGLAMLAPIKDGSAPRPPITLSVVRADDSVVDVSLFDRGQGSPKQVLLITTGSDCRSARSQKWMPQVLSGASVRWVAVVEKDGASPDGACGPTYEAHATEEARWFDTLLAMRVLKDKLHLPLTGGFEVMSISAGGLTGCAVTGASKDVRALVLLSTGGGITFAQELSILNKDHPRVRAQQVQVQEHPQIGRTWLGETNPEIWWWSALPKRCLPLLAGYDGRVLVEQGRNDDAVPPASANALVDGLKREHVAVDFVQMPTGHDLGLADLPSSQNGVARALAWLARE